MWISSFVVYCILTSLRRKLDFEDYESDEEAGDEEEGEEAGSGNESFHEAFENLALEERPILVAAA